MYCHPDLTLHPIWIWTLFRYNCIMLPSSLGNPTAKVGACQEWICLQGVGLFKHGKGASSALMVVIPRMKLLGMYTFPDALYWRVHSRGIVFLQNGGKTIREIQILSTMKCENARLLCYCQLPWLLLGKKSFAEHLWTPGTFWLLMVPENTK